MDDRIAALAAEYDGVVADLSDPAIGSDPKRLADLSRRAKELEAVVACSRSLERARSDAGAARQMIAEATGAEDRELARHELEDAEEAVRRIEGELAGLLVPSDPNDGRNVIVTVRGAEGGEEANLFARDLFEMYVHFAERRRWKLEVLGRQLSERGGFDEVTFLVSGKDAWRRLKHEAGPHRVQRVPVTESAGRVHTSSATVTVLPEVEEVEVELDPADLKIDVYRSTGPGGQSVNTTDSAVRITHLPTGIVVAMQDERSQLQNRARAMQVLRARLAEAERERQEAELAKTRRSQVGGGGRSEKVRTYNFKENRVTDHRVGLTLFKLDRVLAGEVDEISDALVADERARQLAGGGP